MRALLLFLNISCLQAQTDFVAIEQNIINSYTILKEAYKNGDPERQVIFGQKIKKQLLFVLVQDGSYYYPFHRLKNYIHIIESKDKKVKVFSWDAMRAGPWRNMVSLAQFRGSANESYVEILSGEKTTSDLEDYRDVAMQSIDKLVGPKGKEYYLMMGYGSHGAAQHHYTIRLFYLEHNQLLECQDCFEDKAKYWTIVGAQNHDFSLKYNRRRKRISYLEPYYNDQQSSHNNRNKYIKLFWINGKFSP